MRWYIAGPMSNLPMFNFPAFDAARDFLLSQGHEAISPADLDRSRGFDPFDPEGSSVKDVYSKEFIEGCFTADFAAIFNSDGIYMLRGWENSKGAKAEHGLANWMGKHIEYESVLWPHQTPTPTVS